MSNTEEALKAHVRSGARANARALLGLLDGRELDLSEEVEVEDRLERLETQVKREALVPKITRIAEPHLYSEHQDWPNSFFRDLAEISAPGVAPGRDPGGAMERLLRHQRFVDAHPRSTAELSRVGITARADSTVSGHGGEFTSPTFVLEQFASVPRGVGNLAALVHRIPLPEGTVEIHDPRLTVAAGVAAQSAQNTNARVAVATTDAVVAPLATIAGIAPVSLQLLDRGPNLDGLIARDLAESYRAALEQQLIAGTGSTGQMLGVLNVTTRVSQSYTSATPTPAGLVAAVAKLAATVADKRKRPPTALLVRGARYFWLAGSQQGTTGEPIMRPGTGTVPLGNADLGAYGPVSGLATYLDDSLPDDLGTTTNQDVAVVVRAEDCILLESAPRMNVIVGGAGAAAMTADIIFHVYAAFLSARYPESIGVLGGTGFVVPSGF